MEKGRISDFKCKIKLWKYQDFEEIIKKKEEREKIQHYHF
jgi:hypothetical protein